MTIGTEIVEEFHQHTFFYQSMADEWLAKRIDEAIQAAVVATTPREMSWEEFQERFPYKEPTPELRAAAKKYHEISAAKLAENPAKKQRVNRK